jgi:hypothetical protein
MNDMSFLTTDPTDGGGERCYRALARVDEDGEFVLKEGDKIMGSAVGCRILTGPFVNCDVVAKVATELGGGYSSRCIKPGADILIDLLNGKIDHMVFATNSVPGGLNTPLPNAIAGIDISNEESKGKVNLTAPGKGVGLRYYVQGAAYAVRLKGHQPGFAGEFYVECDDGPANGTGTLIHLRMNDQTGKMMVMLRDADGAQIEVHDGKAVLSSPDGSSILSLDNGKIAIVTDELQVNAKVQVYAGLIMHNLPIALAASPVSLLPFAALRGPTGLAGVPSTGTFIGAVL